MVTLAEITHNILTLPATSLQHKNLFYSTAVESGGLVPLPKSWRYDTYVHDIEVHANPESIALCVPFIWQLEPIVQIETRANNLSLIEVHPKNPQLLVPMLQEIQIDVLLVAAPYLDSVLEVLKKATTLPKALTVIATSLEQMGSVSVDCPVRYELHALPGVPLFYQDSSCTLRQDGQYFRRNEALTWSDDGALFTIPDDEHFIAVANPFPELTAQETGLYKLL